MKIQVILCFKDLKRELNSFDINYFERFTKKRLTASNSFLGEEEDLAFTKNKETEYCNHDKDCLNPMDCTLTQKEELTNKFMNTMRKGIY